MDTENSRVRSSLAADWVYWWAFRWWCHCPASGGDDIYTAEQVGYSSIDEDEWLNIVYQTIRGKRQPKVIEDFYAFGFEGNRLPYKTMRLQR